MIDFAPGMRTIIRDEEWMVKKIETNSLGNKTLYCVGISPLVKDREAIFLTDLEEIQIVDPAEVKLVADTSPFYKRALLYLESQWRQQIPTDANLHIGHKAAMDLMPYQLDPAKLALQRPRQRILIADTVGLGKTLEAGILMSELIARGKGKRILVVTVKSMMTQFQKEMWNRFTIPLVRLDSNRIQKIRANLPSNYNPFFYYDKTIVSIDTLKRDVEYRTHLENAYWDIIVIDEAQNVAERGDHQAQRSRLAKLLADRSDTMIMLSATPHDGRAKSFASLMNMLDPTAIADPQNYTPEDIKGLCIRRFKKDVKDQVSGSFLERKITLERCNASAKEEYAFDIFAEMQLEMDLGKTKGTGQLFKTSLEKSLFSSPAACIKSIEARLKKLYKKYTADDIKDIHLLENLKTALEAITPADFTRYQKLLDLIRSKEYAWNPADSGDRVVIFTERIETMKYLAERLRKDLGLKANAIQEISGGMSDAEQQRIVEDFGRTESPVRVLVASDVASEGLNLHYLSHRLIHFDIPWSLMVFQQRNGRIDRYGQQNRPDIRYMLIESDNKRIKGDMRIIEILITKEEQALKNIGDPSLLLGKFTIEDEELVVAETIESGSDSDAFEQTLDAGEDDFDPFEALMAAAGKEEDEDEKKSEIVSDETLFSDMDYLYQALTYLNQTENHPVERLKTVSGLDIRLTPDMERRLKALVPEEALPQGETLRVSDEMEPDRVPLGTKRMPKKQVYHFLLGDPGMCSYSDKVIKQLEPENIKEMKDWNKKFTSPVTDDEVVTLLRLSAAIDELWEAQIQLRKEVGAKTKDALSIFGYTDDAEDSHTTIRQKDKIFSELYKSEHMRNAGPYARLKFAMDYWCALWFWPIDKADLLPTRSEFLFDMSLILEGTMASVNVTDSVKGGQLSLFPTEMEQMAMDIIDTYGTDAIVDIPRLRKENPRLDLAARIAEQNKFMHWELEFADLFAERGGFDLIIGNPPWIKITWNEQSVLSDRQPMFAVKKLSASETAKYRTETLHFADIRQLYFAEFEEMSGEQNFLNAAQNYVDLKGQQTNLFKCFLPQSWMYNSKSGVAAFVHPEGVYDDPKGGALREKLYPRLRYHFQFANERKLFPEVHHHTTFSLNVYGGPLMVSFDTISNLYDAKSIVECYEGDISAPIPGIKDENGEWNTSGHPDRVIY